MTATKLNFKQRFRRYAGVIVGLIVLLIAIRLALPYAVRHYVNRRIDLVQDYAGSVADIDINLWRGAYTIRHLVLVKTNAAVPVPFLTIPEMDLSVEWRALFHGALVGEVSVNGANVIFVNGPNEEQQQTGLAPGWTATLESLFPLTINKFQVKNSAIQFADPHRDPPVDIAISNLWAVATNLTNVRQENVKLPAGLVATGTTTGGGRLELELHLNPLAHSPTFKLVTSVTNVNLVALNDFMRAYGNFDVEAGTFALFLEIAAAEEKIQGQLRPFFFDAKIVTWRETGKQNLFQTLWETVVQGVSELFQNQPEDQLATEIPIAGTIAGDTSMDMWATVGGILRNAFVRALRPQAEPDAVPLPDGSETSTAR